MYIRVQLGPLSGHWQVIYKYLPVKYAKPGIGTYTWLADVETVEFLCDSTSAQNCIAEFQYQFYYKFYFVIVEVWLEYQGFIIQ